MTSVVSKVWVRSADDDLVRADAIIGLRCRAGEVEACWLGGGCVRLAGPNCPPDFHLQLLAELAELVGRSDSRCAYIVSPQSEAGQAGWVHMMTDCLVEG